MFKSAGASASAVTSGAAAVEIDFDMNTRRQYRITAGRAPLWFRVVVRGATGTDAAQIAGAGSHYLAAGAWMDVAAIGRADNPATSVPNADYRGRVSIIRDTGTDALGVLSEIPTVQTH